ncbi:hypothetical protein AYI70_g9583, partial [Smittium culicis]
MNQQSNIFNQQIDLEPEGTFASPMIPVFSNNLSEGSESCFSGKVKLPDPPKFDGTPKEFQAFES